MYIIHPVHPSTHLPCTTSTCTTTHNDTPNPCLPHSKFKPSIYPFIKYLLSLFHILHTLSKLLTGHWGAGRGHEPEVIPACSSQFRNREITLNRQIYLPIASICQQGMANELMSKCICISHTHTFQIQKKSLTFNRMMSHL